MKKIADEPLIKFVNGLVLKEGNILVVKKKGFWILPGGKLDNGESDLECLSREFEEEIFGAKIKNEIPYNVFLGIIPYSKKEIIVRTYFAELDGVLNMSSREISGVCYVPLFSEYTKNLSDITWSIMLSLKKEGYLALMD